MNDQLALLLGQAVNLYPRNTEKLFPHVVERISLLWGTPGMERYFEDLLFDQRGDRAGFPPEVMSELFALNSFHLSQRPSRTELKAQWHDPANLARLDRFKKQDID